MAHTIGEVARLARISVRALHHYDEIGLLVPQGRSRAGYRLYTEADLGRLRQVLLFRALGFPLEGIQRALDAPGFDLGAALATQRARLVEREAALRTMIGLVDDALHALEGGMTMTHETMFEGLGDFDAAAHEAEAKARWGETDAYAESARRTGRYTKDDWVAIRAEADAITAALAEALDAALAPQDPRVGALVERHRMHIDRWFYPCSRAMHAALGEMYVADPRFRETYDRVRAGLAEFIRDAIAAEAGAGDGGA